MSKELKAVRETFVTNRNAVASGHDRWLEIDDETRDDSEGLPKLRGYAAVYDQPSEPLPWTEVVKPGAFDRSLARGDDVRALIDHKSDLLIGRRSSKTLRMESDAKGLKVIITPPNNTNGRNIVESVRRGDIDGMSFGFITRTDNWHYVDGEEVRELIDVDLFDVSVVTWPAYTGSEVDTRSHDAWVKQRKSSQQIRDTLQRLRIAQLQLVDD